MSNRTSPYYTDVDVRIKIHECERQIAALNANIGKDNRYLEEGKELTHKIKVLLAEIQILDPEYHSEICPAR